MKEPGIFQRTALGALAGQSALQPPGEPVMPGSAQFDANRPSPTGDPPRGGSRRYVLSMPLITNLSGVHDYTGLGATPTATWRVNIPSARLHTLIAWTFEPDATEDTTIPNTWLVSADAWIRPVGRRLTRANNIFTNLIVPTSWDFGVTGIDQVRGGVVVPADVGEGGGGTGAAGGTLYLTAMWEPAAGWYPNDAELEKLFNACHITVEGITTSELG